MSRERSVRRLSVIGALAGSVFLIPVLAGGASDIDQALQLQARVCRPWVVDLRPKATLTAVEAGPRRVWVTGGGGLVLRREGGRWSSTTIPRVDAIVDVAAAGASAWAVGVRRGRFGWPTGAYVFRWSGDSWQRVRVPGLPPARQGLEFRAVDADARDVWLTGGYDNSDERTMGSGWLTARLHAGRWETYIGRSGSYGGLSGVFTVDAADAWAVGAQGPTMSSAQELILHWNGSRWIDLSRYDYVYRLNDVLAFARDDAWAVGETNLDAFPQDARRPAIEHWNGKRWVRVAVPAWKRPSAPRLHSLAAFGRRDVWAAGEKADGRPALLHWDGVRWREALPPPVTTAVRDVAAAPDGTLWAVGERFVAHARCR